jgi:hypothetical protein
VLPLSLDTHTLVLNAIDLLTVVVFERRARVPTPRRCLAMKGCLVVEGKSKGEIERCLAKIQDET